MDNLIFLDTETTGNDLVKDRLCEVCYQTPEGIFKSYFKPPIPVSIKSMSITNITNKMLADKEPFLGSAMKKDLEDRIAQGGIIVAHNAKFDLAMLSSEGVAVPKHICTLRVARYLDPDNLIPEYNLPYLRYHLDLDVTDANAHEAEGDVKVLRALFKRLFDKIANEGLSEDAAIEKMIDISNKPTLLKIIGFGKHKGKKLEDVAKTDRGYLEWLLGQKMAEGGQDEDWIYTLQHFLK